MSVWPKPRSCVLGTSAVWLSPNLKFSYEHVDKDDYGSHEHEYLQTLKGISDPSLPVKLRLLGPDEDASAHFRPAFSKSISTLFSEPFIPYKMHPRNIPNEPSPSQPLPTIELIQIKHLSPSPPSRNHPFSPESHRLTIDSHGACIIHVTHPLGTISALSTFTQLFYGTSHSTPNPHQHLYCPHVPLTITDEPRFSHRGVNLDISRNIIHPRDVKRTLDAMWLCKLNKLHIHATDSQSWPLMIPAMPELAEKGAYHASQIWHPEDLREVQEHGRELGIGVYLEIDLPGHTGSIWHSHPDLTLAYDKRPWDRWAVEPPAGQLKLNSEDVLGFIRRLFDDVGPRVNGFTGFFHVGGDELNTNCYTLEEGIGSSDKEVLRPFMERFFKVVFEMLKKHELTPIMWEDILLDFDLEFPKDSIFQVWRKHDSLTKILEQGYRAIFGPSDFWYLDVGLGTFLDPDPSNKDSPVKPPFPDWNPPYKNWRLVYSYNPFEGVPEKHHERMIGGEVSNWGELTDSVNLDSMLWPRVAAAAEVLWSGPGKVSEDVTRRLAELRERLVLHGIAANVVQMEWSLRHRARGTL